MPILSTRSLGSSAAVIQNAPGKAEMERHWMRLLIAEDDKALGMFLSRGLEADGHRVRLAHDGGAAVEAFREEMPDLTILDLNMPVKDGEQVLREIRAFNAELPILVLT